MSKWTPADVPNLAGKTVLVTGANSGIGFEAARGFAKRGAHVVLACRDREKGEAAVQRIAAEASGQSIALLLLDLASLASIRSAAERFCGDHERLDILCNNAGVMRVPRRLTEDGFELQLGVNHFGHFALTGLLLERLLASGPARIVTVSSIAHRMGRLHIHDLDGVQRYQKWEAYGQSKLANLLFAFELQRRLQAKGARTISVACHPGYANTNLQQVGPLLEGSRLRSAFYLASNTILAQSAEKGAWPTLYAATAPDVQGGDFIGPRGPGQLAGAPIKVGSTRASHDPEVAGALWQISVERTRVAYEALA